MSDLISRTKAIHALADADAKKLWKRLKFSEIQKCLLDLPPEGPKWIPVTERMPEENYGGKYVATYSDYVFMSIRRKDSSQTVTEYGHTTNGRWYLDVVRCFLPTDWEVIAWMPIPEPEPWKGEKDDERI